METISHECYVSLEVAKLLKDAGFDWRCRAAYRDSVLVFQENSLYDNFNGKQYENGTSHEFFSAPTLDVAQKWLREVMEIEVFVEPFIGFYKYVVEELKDNGLYSDGREKSYEKCQESGIIKALVKKFKKHVSKNS